MNRCSSDAARGLSLTSSGEALLPRAEELLGIAARAKEEVAAITGLAHGTLRIGTNDSNCLYVLPEVISAFRTEHPGLRFHIENGHSTRVAEWVVNARVEIGVVTLPLTTRDLRSQPLYERHDVLILPPRHPLADAAGVSPSALSAFPFLMLHGGSVSHDRLSSTLRAANAMPQSIMRVGSVEVIKRYVELGLGIAVVPELNVANEVADGRLISRPLPWLPRLSVGIVSRPSGYLSPAMRVFVSRLVAKFRAGA